MRTDSEKVRCGPETDWRNDRQSDLNLSFLLVIASVVASFLSKWKKQSR